MKLLYNICLMEVIINIGTGDTMGIELEYLRSAYSVQLLYIKTPI